MQRFVFTRLEKLKPASGCQQPPADNSHTVELYNHEKNERNIRLIIRLNVYAVILMCAN